MTSKSPPPNIIKTAFPTSKVWQNSHHKSKNPPTPLSIPDSSSESHPKPTAQRTHSDSLPPPSSTYVSNPNTSSSHENLQRASTEGPKSAGYEAKNVTFGFGKHAEDGDKHRKVDPLKRRPSNEHHVNVYTECGRHSDDWLFGGLSLGEVVRKLWGPKG